MQGTTQNGKGKKRLISAQMLLFEFRNTIGNPYVHIFGIGMPVLMMVIITRAVASEWTEGFSLSAITTSIFLGIGALIPMATVFMGYGISHAQEMEKGIPQRMELFGIRTSVTLCSRILSEVLFMVAAFVIYFVAGTVLTEIDKPALSGVMLYVLCILALSVILFALAYSISTFLKKFSLTYCVTMLLYFAMMILGGMMGISYDNMPIIMQIAAKMLPVTYINRDFYEVWKGNSYNFVPMIQSYLLCAAVAGILLFFAVKRTARKLH